MLNSTDPYDIFPCDGGPHAGQEVAIQRGHDGWVGGGYLLPADTLVSAPPGGVYRLDETRSYLRWQATS